MPKNHYATDTGTWIVRDVPKELMRRAKAAAAMEGRSVKSLLIDLMQEYVHDREKKGVLPRGR